MTVPTEEQLDTWTALLREALDAHNATVDLPDIDALLRKHVAMQAVEDGAVAAFAPLLAEVRRLRTAASAQEERERCVAYASARRVRDSALDAEEAAVRGIQDVDAGEYPYAELPIALRHARKEAGRTDR